MPLIVESVQEAQFSQSPELEKWIGSTQQALTRIPVQGVLAHGAKFLDDE